MPVAEAVARDAARTAGGPFTILDRYLIAELTGPFLFGLSAFTLIFVATQILAIGKLVSDDHAPLGAAIAYFIFDTPQFLLLVIPMAMLFGTLLSMQRLSSESEVTAMKAGGVSLGRIVAPLLLVGFIVSLFSLAVQELLVPLANERAAAIKREVIEHLSPLAGNLSFVKPLANGGFYRIQAADLDAKTQSLIRVIVVEQDKTGRTTGLISSDRAQYDASTAEWAFFDATTWSFALDSSVAVSHDPTLQINLGEKPDQIGKNVVNGDPEQYSRAELRGALDSGQLSAQQTKQYAATYASKLARPFAAFVFTLIAFPFGLRPPRGGGGMGVGFGLAVAIVFIYYVISSVFLTVGEQALWLAGIAAWAPNAIFTAIGLLLLRRAAAI